MIQQIDLRRAFDKYASETFAWGSLDCCLFTALVLKEVHGVDYRTQFPDYGSRREAVNILRKFGSLRGLVESLFGDPVEPGELRDADIGYVSVKGISAVGPVCNGRVVLKSKHSVFYVPVENCDMGWQTWPR